MGCRSLTVLSTVVVAVIAAVITAVIAAVAALAKVAIKTVKVTTLMKAAVAMGEGSVAVAMMIGWSTHLAP